MENENLPKEEDNEVKPEVEEKADEILEESAEEVKPEEGEPVVAERIAGPAEVTEPEPTPEPASEPEPVPTEEPKIEKTEDPISSTPEPKDEEPKQPNKTGIIVAIIAAIAALGFIGLFILPKFLMTGKKVVDKEVTYLFTQARETLKENKKNILQYNLDSDSLGLEGTLTIDSDYKGNGIDLSKLKDYEIKYNGSIDKKGNKASGTIGLVNKSKDLINVDAYAEGKEAYIALGDIYEKTIKTELDKEINELDLSATDNFDDLDRLLEKTEKIVKDTVKDKDIKKTKEEKEFNGKKEKYTKVEYTIKTQEFTKEILEAYQKDNEIIKLLANLTQKTEKYVKESLEDSIENLKDSDNDETVIVNIYLKGITNTAEAFELVSDDAILEVVKDKDIYKYSYKLDGKEYFGGEYNTKDKTFTLNSDQGLSVKANLNLEKTTVDINYKDDDQTLNINAVMNNKVSKSTQDNDTTIKINYNVSGEKINATIKNKMQLEKGKKVEELDAKNTIDADDISDEEMQKIENKLYEKLNQVINDIMPSSSDFRKLA